MNKLLTLMVLLMAAMFLSCSSEEEPMISIDDPNEPDDPNMEMEMEVEGDPAPDFELVTFEDVPLKSSDFEDQNLVIFFFGNSCPPCQAVGPDVESQLNIAFEDKENYSIIGIDQWDGNSSSVESFRDRTGITFPLGIMGSGVARDFGTTYDRLVVVNAEGNIIYRGNSIAANNLAEVVTIVTELLQ